MRPIVIAHGESILPAKWRIRRREGNPLLLCARTFGKYAGGILNPASLIREAVCPKPADESEKRAFNELAVVDAITICPRRNSSPIVPVFSASGWVEGTER